MGIISWFPWRLIPDSFAIVEKISYFVLLNKHFWCNPDFPQIYTLNSFNSIHSKVAYTCVHWLRLINNVLAGQLALGLEVISALAHMLVHVKVDRVELFLTSSVFFRSFQVIFVHPILSLSHSHTSTIIQQYVIKPKLTYNSNLKKSFYPVTPHMNKSIGCH